MCTNKFPRGNSDCESSPRPGYLNCVPCSNPGGTSICTVSSLPDTSLILTVFFTTYHRISFIIMKLWNIEH